MKKFIPLMLLVFVILYACQSEKKTSDKQAIIDTINTIEKSWLEASHSRDFVKATSYYSENGVIMNQGAPVLAGLSEIRKAAEVAYADTSMLWNTLQWTNEKTDISEAGDMAVVKASYTMKIKTPDGEIDVAGKGLEVFKKENGIWRVIYTMYNLK